MLVLDLSESTTCSGLGLFCWLTKRLTARTYVEARIPHPSRAVRANGLPLRRLCSLGEFFRQSSLWSGLRRMGRAGRELMEDREQRAELEARAPCCDTPSLIFWGWQEWRPRADQCLARQEEIDGGGCCCCCCCHCLVLQPWIICTAVGGWMPLILADGIQYPYPGTNERHKRSVLLYRGLHVRIL